MKLRITSITASEVGELINSVSTALEDQLCPVIELRDYGGDIQQFIVFFISVDSDFLENERYCIANNRASQFKDRLTGKMVRYVGLAVPVNPAVVLDTPKEALKKNLQNLLLEELAAPPYAMPKKFNRQALLDDLRVALQQGSPQT